MSKMMDNLARVQEEHEEPAKKPAALFVVKEQAPPSSGTFATADPRRKAMIWATVALSLAIVGIAFYVQGRQSAPPAALPVITGAEFPSSAEAVQLIRSGNFKAAKQHLDQQLAKKPAWRAGIINRAYALKKIGQLGVAEREYKALLEKHPLDSIALNNLGALYLSLGQFAQAEAMLRKAADAGSADAVLNLGFALEKQRNWPGALKIFEELLEKENPHPNLVQIRERVRRLRSLSASVTSPKEAY